MIEQAVIFCGGLGTRLLPLTKLSPKPMVHVNKKPFLFHLINQCKSNGIKNIVLLCGYKHEYIKKYFGNGNRFGVKIDYSYNSTEIETYSRLYNARKLLKSKFLLLYGDNYSSLNLHDLFTHYRKYKSKIILTICKKNKGNIQINYDTNKIIKYFSKKNQKAKFVEIGYMIVDKKTIIANYNFTNVSLSYFIKKLSKNEKVHFYLNDTGYLSISDPKRLKITDKYFSKKLILIDRDGVLNLKNNKHYYVRNPKELMINYNFLHKYKKNLRDKFIICITNQAGIATGDLSVKNLIKINKEIMKSYLRYKIKISHFLISKHHFESNHFLRKPNHGLFLQAAQKYQFVLDKTYYIGDDIRDIEASYRAKTKCLYIGKKSINNSLKIRYRHTLISKPI